jgi:hypothetical protein
VACLLDGIEHAKKCFTSVQSIYTPIAKQTSNVLVNIPYVKLQLGWHVSYVVAATSTETPFKRITLMHDHQIR